MNLDPDIKQLAYNCKSGCEYDIAKFAYKYGGIMNSNKLSVFLSEECYSAFKTISSEYYDKYIDSDINDRDVIQYELCKKYLELSESLRKTKFKQNIEKEYNAIVACSAINS